MHSEVSDRTTDEGQVPMGKRLNRRRINHVRCDDISLLVPLFYPQKRPCLPNSFAFSNSRKEIQNKTGQDLCRNRSILSHTRTHPLHPVH